MIVLAILVALEAIVCISLEVRFEKLVRKHNELVHHTKTLAETTRSSFTGLSNVQDEQAKISEEMFEFIKDVSRSVENVSHETADIKRYYCNYVSKKGNE